MDDSILQSLCQRGQERLSHMDYLGAQRLLEEAELLAGDDFDTLARLYMPLQEARRQRRQRCAEGVVRLDLIAAGPQDRIDALHVIENFPQGQLLVAGWGSVAPARQVRALQREHGLYVETLLGAVYPPGVDHAGAVAIVPLEDASLPPPEPRSLEQLRDELPAHSIVLALDAIPAGARRGDPRAVAEVMSLWEQLSAPFVLAADTTADPRARIAAYRRAIRVDYACELAHQRLADTARSLAGTAAWR